MIYLLEPEYTIELHNEYLGIGVKSDHLLESCWSSIYYYDDVLDKVISVFIKLIKNHPFHDGNKRTSVYFITYCMMGEPNHEELEELVKDISSNTNPNHDEVKK